MITVPLYLGDFLFTAGEFSVPDNMGDLGGMQAVEQHDFPGGYRTHQTFGYFPAPIKWRGHFTGSTASDRVEQLKRILIAGNEIPLTYGGRAWLGRLVRFTPHARHTWLFDYELEYWPRIDTSSGVGEFGGQPDLNSLMDLHVLSLLSIANAVASESFFSLIAIAVALPVLNLVATVDTATLAAGGMVSNIDVAGQVAIYDTASQVGLAVAPLLTNPDPRLSSPAWDINSRAMVINSLAQSASTPRWVVTAVNPSLPALAAQYYGDATQWRVIGDANGIYDPQPVGTFQLQIPPPP